MKEILRYIIPLLLVVAMLPAQARDYTVKSVPNVQVTDRNQHVSDPSSVLSAGAKSTINRTLTQLRDSTSVEVAVVLLPSIGNSDIDNFATELFTHWGIGKEKNDNGLLILAVMDQRQIVFRTGYGLEGVLPDVICFRIIDDYIKPAFKKGNYDKGMIDAVNKTYEALIDPDVRAELMAEEPLFDEKDKAILLGLLFAYLIISIIISVVLTVKLQRIVRNNKNTPYEGFKQLKKLKSVYEIIAIFFPLWNIYNLKRHRKSMTDMRNKPIVCTVCNTLMHRLSERDDNAFLTPQEDKEEQIGSVDYDVWMCDNCQNVEVFGYENESTRYTECPHCHAKAFSLTRNHVVIPATTLAAGRGEKIYSCSYCNTRKVVPYIIPIIVTGTAIGGGKGGFGGGIGGGFGGGMTGGGGARGGW